MKTLTIILATALAATISGSASAQNNDNRNHGNWHQHENRTTTVICESKDMRRHRCATDTPGQITITRQLSRKSRCVQGRSWGFDNHGIWVDHGCRAEFLISGEDGTYDRDRDHRASQATQTVVCESSGRERTYCRAANRFGVDLTREISRNNCVANRTWGSDANGVWVSNGCRAEFSMRTRL